MLLRAGFLVARVLPLFFLLDGIVPVSVVVVLIDNPEASRLAHWGCASQPEVGVSGVGVQFLNPG